jgi:hypothetical protein
VYARAASSRLSMRSPRTSGQRRHPDADNAGPAGQSEFGKRGRWVSRQRTQHASAHVGRPRLSAGPQHANPSFWTMRVTSRTQMRRRNSRTRSNNGGERPVLPPSTPPAPEMRNRAGGVDGLNVRRPSNKSSTPVPTQPSRAVPARQNFTTSYEYSQTGPGPRTQNVRPARPFALRCPL